MDVFDLVAKLTLDSSEYDKGLGGAETSASSFGEEFGSVLAGIGGAAGLTVTAVTAVGAATVGMGKAVVDSAKGVAEYGDNIDKMSQKMGISIEAYQEWDAVMQHSGTSMETMKTSMKTLANAVEKGNEAFERIGLTQEQLASMNQEQIFESTIAGLQNVEDVTERTYLAGQLLGRGATELGALLNTSAEDTQAMRDRVRELGGVMSEEAVKASAQFQDNLQDLQASLDGMKRGIVGELLPAFNDLMDGFTKLISGEEGADEALTSGIDNLITGAGNIAEKVMDIATEVFPRLIEGLAEKAPELINKLIEGTKEIPTKILGALKDSVIPTIMESLPELMASYLEELPAMLQDEVDFLAEFLPMAVGLITDLISMMAESLDDTYPIITQASIELMTIFINALLENLPALIQAALIITTAYIDGIISALPQIISAVLQIAVQVIATIIELIPTLVATAVRIITEFLTTIVITATKFLTGDYWKKMLEGIVKSFTNIDWKGLGTMLTTGLANGITAGFTKVKDAVTGIANGIKDKFTSIFDIHSPSKLFEYYGEMLNQGLAEGIEEGNAIKSTQDLADDIEGAFNATLKADENVNGSVGIGGGITYDLLTQAIVDALTIMAPELQSNINLQADTTGIVKAVVKANRDAVNRNGRGIFA